MSTTDREEHHQGGAAPRGSEHHRGGGAPQCREHHGGGGGSVSTREEEERPDGRSVCFHWSKSERASQINVPLNRKLEIA